MRSPVSRGLTFLCTLMMASPFTLELAYGQQAGSPESAETIVAKAANASLAAEEMEVLVARIALYPDDLVAAIVSASLYPLQIVEAGRFLENKETKKDLQPSKSWDGSVISLLNTPEIVKMMSDDLEWTQALGEAAVNQQEDLLAAIQQLRERAVAKGVLKSNDKVVIEQAAATDETAGGPVGQSVVIKSADPEVVYVPQYPPEMLYEENYVLPEQPIYYEEPYPSYWYPSAPYWAGLITGAIWAGSIDWDGDRFWGGDVDVDIDWDSGDINIGDVNIGKFDRNNVDLSKIDRGNLDLSKIDRSKLNFDKGKINRDTINRDLKSRNTNRLDSKVGNRGAASTLPGAVGNRPQTKDVRKSIEQGLKQPAGKTRPGASNKATAGGATAGKLPSKGDRPGGGDRAQAKGGKAKSGAKSTGPRPGSRPDSRPKSAGAIGDYQRGTQAKSASNRAKASRAAPQYRPPSSGGRQMSRGGGRGGGGGGRGGGGRRR